MGIFERIFGGNEPPVFAMQLGKPIDAFSESSAAVKQVAWGLSLCANGDFNSGLPFLVSRGDHLQVKEITPTGKHGYANTELLALAMQAREKGALPPSWLYDWMRKDAPILRDLLAHLGRPVQPLSCAGVVAHYHAEVQLGQAIKEPMVKFAEDAYAAHYPASEK